MEIVFACVTWNQSQAENESELQTTGYSVRLSMPQEKPIYELVIWIVWTFVIDNAPTGRSVIFIEVKRIDFPLRSQKQHNLGYRVPLFDEVSKMGDFPRPNY